LKGERRAIEVGGLVIGGSGSGFVRGVAAGTQVVEVEEKGV
jgi:hypothetical protein